MRTYRIRPLPLTLMEVDMPTFTSGMNYGRKIRVPLYSWYIEGADDCILVDTGADAKMAVDFRGLPAEEITSFEDALAGVGLKPGDVNLVIQTHLHWDHCGNTYKCKQAKVVVTEDELRFALSPHPIQARMYNRSLLKDLNFVVVSGYTELAPGIELFPAPGHTPGTQAVCINTTKGKAIITGFCSIRETFEPPEEVREIMPVLYPGLAVNALDAFDSALKVKGRADILIPQHDPAFVEVKSIP
jgi:N-acyl homoserine lactone hydrolase